MVVFYLLCLLTSLIPIVLIYCLVTVHHYQNYFQQQGIPSPPFASSLTGHFKMLWQSERFSEQLWHWTKEYGSMVGFVAGRSLQRVRPLSKNELDF